MEDNMMASGKTIRWKEKESSSGLMVVNTKENMSMIRRRVEESSTGKY